MHICDFHTKRLEQQQDCLTVVIKYHIGNCKFTSYFRKKKLVRFTFRQFSQRSGNCFFF